MLGDAAGDPRLRQRFQRLLGRALRASAPVSVTVRPLPGEPVGWRQAREAPAQPFRVGEAWGPAWGTALFELTGTVPASWTLADTVLVVGFDDGAAPGFGAEALAYDAGSGRALGGLSPMHPWVGVPAREVCVVVEAAANPVAWGRTVPEAGDDPTPLFRLAAAHLALLDRDVFAELLDTRLAMELAALPAAGGGWPPTQARAHAVGNAHIDTAWLWPYRETRRKIARTLATALALAQRYPDYRFAVSQPQQLEWLREDDPQLFDRVAAAVRAGRVECVGAMWVEADTNLPAGESLARQILHGQRWWAEHFGVAAAEVWLPDAFGFSPALPGLMRHAGLRRFVTQKLSWNDTNRMPHHTFWWQGLDGRRVLAHFPPAGTYGAQMSVAELHRFGAALRDGGDPAPGLFLFGFGDGGGGPTEAMLEMAARVAARPELPAVRLGTVGGFFADLQAQLPPDLPTWVGELYLEYHRGTYTTHGWLKSALRRAEALLREAEALAVAVGLTPAPTLDGAWRQLLLQQFHDVAPGTSIARVNREARAALAQTAAAAESLSTASLSLLSGRVDTAGLGDPLLVWDPSEHGRTDLVVLDEPVAGAQPTADGGHALLVRTPPLGWATVDLARPAPAPRPVRGSVTGLDNGVLRVGLAGGELTSLVEAASGRELLAAPAGLDLLRDEPRNWDAWDIDREAFDTTRRCDGEAGVELVEAGPLRAAVRVSRGLGERSTVACTYALVAGAPRLDVTLDIDWQEEHRLLKFAVPVAVHAATVTGEVAWGELARPVHRNTSWERARFEFCAHRWLDVGEPGFGVALLNDGRYGHDVAALPDGAGCVLRVSLLRAPNWPDPTVDRGRHRVRLAILVHHGDRVVVRGQAAALNTARRWVRPAPGAGDLPPTGRLLAATPEHVELVALKGACDDPDVLVARLVETTGARAVATLDGELSVRQWRRADLLERSTDPWQSGAVRVPLRPFEVATILLRR